MHTGLTIFASQLVARIIAEQGSSNFGAGMKNDWHPGELCLYLQDFLRISHGCHERADRGAIVLETHIRIARSCRPSPALTPSTYTVGTQTVLTCELYSRSSLVKLCGRIVQLFVHHTFDNGIHKLPETPFCTRAASRDKTCLTSRFICIIYVYL